MIKVLRPPCRTCQHSTDSPKTAGSHRLRKKFCHTLFFQAAVPSGNRFPVPIVGRRCAQCSCGSVSLSDVSSSGVLAFYFISAAFHLGLWWKCFSLVILVVFPVLSFVSSFSLFIHPLPPCVSVHGTHALGRRNGEV